MPMVISAMSVIHQLQIILNVACSLNLGLHAAGPCYRCMFPEAPQASSCSRCSDAGVLGVVPGVIGTLQALEAIKLASGVSASRAPLWPDFVAADGV